MSTFIWNGYNLISKNTIEPFSMLNSILFLIKGEDSIEQSKKLLTEIYQLLQKKSYPEINEKDYEDNIFKYKIEIKKDLTNATFYLSEFDKRYYLFSNNFRKVFTDDSKIFQYSKTISNYIINRIDYMKYKNKLIQLMENPSQNCNQAIETVKEKEYIITSNLISNLVNNQFNDNIDFYSNIDMLTDILELNIVIFDSNKKINTLIENNDKYKYILLWEYDKQKYKAIYTKKDKFFPSDSDLITDIKKDKMIGLDNITENLVDDDIEQYINNLDLA